MNVCFHEGAETDFEEAIRYYQQQQEGLGPKFAKAVKAAVKNLAEATRAAPAVYRDCRFRRVHKFPYLLIYRVENDVIHILAIAHQKRNLSYWHTRLTD